MRTNLLTAVLSLALLASSGAYAATRDFMAVFGVEPTPFQTALDNLGADTSTTEIVVTWSVNSTPNILAGPTLTDTPDILARSAQIAYENFTISLGGVTLTANNALQNFNRIAITDVEENRSGLNSDFYQIGAFQAFSPTNPTRAGLRISNMFVDFASRDTAMLNSAVAQPDANTLFALDQFARVRIRGSSIQGAISIDANNLISVTETTPQIPPVPLPAGAVLMLSALGFLAATRSKRSCRRQ